MYERENRVRPILLPLDSCGLVVYASGVWLWCFTSATRGRLGGRGFCVAIIGLGVGSFLILILLCWVVRCFGNFISPRDLHLGVEWLC
jgi:hypothetical protein